MAIRRAPAPDPSRGVAKPFAGNGSGVRKTGGGDAGTGVAPTTTTDPALTPTTAKTKAANAQQSGASVFVAEKGPTRVGGEVVRDLLDVQGPVQGALDVRLGASTKSTGVEASATEKLIALVKPLAQAAAAGAMGEVPAPRLLKKLLDDQLGPLAQKLSPDECARLLGNPAWAGAVRALGPKASDTRTGPEPHFLLAAQVAKWMAGTFEGANLDQVAKSFLIAHPLAAQRYPHLDGEFVAVLQELHEFVPPWSTKPKAAAAVVASDDWTQMADPTVAANVDPKQTIFEAALTQLGEVPLAMALTGGVAERLTKEQSFANHNVVMVQHMLGQAIPFCDAMVRAGLDVKNAEFVGVPYQKNPAVKLSLERMFGMPVTVPAIGDMESMWQHVCAAVDRAVERHKVNGQPILMIDDGGYGSKYLAKKYPELAPHVKVVEQTTRGLTELSQIDAKFPVVNVAGSYGKRFESAQVGDAVKQAVRRVLDSLTTTPARKDVLVVGAGKVGVGVADSFAADGARVTILDPFITPGRKKQLERAGYKVLTDKAQALDKKFLVVGCSGHRSIDMNDFAKMGAPGTPVFIASASSKQVEIDIKGLEELATGKDGVLRRILATKVGEQETFHYWLKDGRMVTAMAETRPVNFQGVNSIAPELIDHTMALMLLGAGQATTYGQSGGKGDGKGPSNGNGTSSPHGLVDLESVAQFELQAQMEGLSSTRSNASDVEIKVPRGADKTAGKTSKAGVADTISFFGSPEQWRAVAKSPATPPAVLHAMLETRLGKPADGSAWNPPIMDPLVLDVLAAHHEVSDATIDLVLDLKALPHVGRLLQNEMLTDAQEDRLLKWVEDVFWAHVGSNAYQGEAAPVQAVAVEGTAERGYGYVYSNIHTLADGRTMLRPGVTSVRDTLVRDSGALLFAHSRAPAYLKEALLRQPYSFARDGQSSTVLRIASPATTTEELDKLFPEMADGAFSYATQSSKPQYIRYGYDLLEAFRDHENASPEIQKLAARYMLDLEERGAKSGVSLQGRAGWQMTPLGVALPEYQ